MENETGTGLQFVSRVIRTTDITLPADPLDMFSALSNLDKHVKPVVIVALSFTRENTVPLIRGTVKVLENIAPEGTTIDTLSPDEQIFFRFIHELISALKVGWQ